MVLDVKLEKLLNLTRSPNPHEAAAAQKKVNEYLTANNLVWADLFKAGQETPEPEPVYQEPEYVKPKYEPEYQKPRPVEPKYESKPIKKYVHSDGEIILKLIVFAVVVVVLYYVIVFIYNLILAFIAWWALYGIFLVIFVIMTVIVLISKEFKNG